MSQSIKGDHFLETSNHIVVAYRGLVKPTAADVIRATTRSYNVRGARVKKGPDVRTEPTNVVPPTVVNMHSPRCHILSILSIGVDFFRE